MGNNCSYKQQLTERSQVEQQNSMNQKQGIQRTKIDSLIGGSQLTQMEIPNAQLQSPTKPYVPKQNEVKSLVRVPSEESLFLKQFSQMKESKGQIQSSSQQCIKPKSQMNLKSSLKKKSIQNEVVSPKFQSSSPKKKKKIHDKSQSHSPIQNSWKMETKKTKKKEQPPQNNQFQEIVRRRKYSDLPEKKEQPLLVRRKISDICDDHNYIIGMENYSPTKFRTYTPNSILKRKDSDVETNSPQKKVRFKDQNGNRKLHQ